MPAAILEGSLSEARSHAFQELARPGSRGSHWDIAQMVLQVANAEDLRSGRDVARFLRRGKSQVAEDLKIGRAFAGASVDAVMTAWGLEAADLARATKNTLLRVASIPGLTPDDRLERLAPLIVQLAETENGGESPEFGAEQASECAEFQDPVDAPASDAGEISVSHQSVPAAEALASGEPPEIAPEEAGELAPGGGEDDAPGENVLGAMAPVDRWMSGTPETATSGAPPRGGQAMATGWVSSMVPRLQDALIPRVSTPALTRTPAWIRMEGSAQLPSIPVRHALLGLVLFLLLLLAACPGTTTPKDVPDSEAVLVEADGARKTGIGAGGTNRNTSRALPQGTQC